MKAMIMAAGVGTRLVPMTATLPKPMLPILGKPLMQYTVELLKRYGITEIIANLHYLPEIISNHFKDWQDLDVNIKFSLEEKLLGTAGGVKNNQWFLEDDTFIVLSGDGLTDINLTELYYFHKQKKAIATIALKPVEDVAKFGVVVLDKDNKITAFQEKPQKEEALSSLVNTGIYMFEPEIFDYIPKKKIYDFGKELFPLLAQENLPFYGWETDAYWSDIGSFDTYKEAQFDLLCNKIDVKLDQVWRQLSTIRGACYNGVCPSVKLAGQLYLGDGSEINSHTSLFGHVIIGKNTFIGSNTVLHNCIILDNVKIGSNTFITDSIIGNGCIIKDCVVIHGDCVVAEYNVISNQEQLRKGAKIWPGKMYDTAIYLGDDLMVPKSCFRV